jgi:YD repeat-containing protein
MQQVETSYDAASNVIQQLTRRRFHDATGSGGLGSPTVTPYARVSYLCFWPDALGRTKNQANYGTNGGSTLSRPSTAPARSDTVLVTTTDFNDRGEAYQTSDPKGTKFYAEFDHAGRQTKKIDNYVDGIPSGDTDRTVELTYNTDGRLKTLTTKNSVTGDQVTKYVYGTTLTESDVASNDLLRATIYPDSDDTDSPLGNGADNTYDRVEFKYNRQGEPTEKKDQLTTVHTLEYDKLGRLLHDRVTTLASGVDGAVRRISRTYEVRGMLAKITSYDNATVGTGNVANESEFTYNGFGQLTKEAQSHSGAVGSSSPNVQYGYANGSANHIRPTSLTYPDGRVVDFSYGSAGSASDILSTVYELKISTTALARYTSWLGMDQLALLEYPQPGVELTYIKQSGESDGDGGDKYTGLDRFARVVDHRWRKQSSGAHLERVQYGFDRASNRQWRDNLVASGGQDEYYSYDGLYQLTLLQRGDLNAGKTGISGTPTKEEDFNYDPTGNWHGSTSGYVTKTSGTTDLDHNRTHNAANELTAISTTTGPAWVAPVHDRNGNMTAIPQPAALTNSYTCTYDAWNRLSRYKLVSRSHRYAAKRVSHS